MALSHQHPSGTQKPSRRPSEDTTVTSNTLYHVLECEPVTFMPGLNFSSMSKLAIMVQSLTSSPESSYTQPSHQLDLHHLTPDSGLARDTILSSSKTPGLPSVLEPTGPLPLSNHIFSRCPSPPLPAVRSRYHSRPGSLPSPLASPHPPLGCLVLVAYHTVKLKPQASSGSFVPGIISPAVWTSA